RLPRTLGPYGQNVLLDLEVDVCGIDARQVEVNVEVVAPAVGVDRHYPGGPVALGEAVELAVELPERIEAHEHCLVPPATCHIQQNHSAPGPTLAQQETYSLVTQLLAMSSTWQGQGGDSRYQRRQSGGAVAQ